MRYVHVGTGNYNSTTARSYEDLGLLTSDADITADLSELFNVLTGYSQQDSYRSLVVSPHSTRKRILALIEERAASERGRIVMKMNSLVDRRVIEALYDASRAGVEIDLIVRGICCLVPGVADQSENIHVRSVVGRYLEHSRVYRFGDTDYLIGSADMMPRNLDGRVEVLVPVDHPPLRARVDQILGALLLDDQLAWTLGDAGEWTRVAPTDDGVDGVDAQERLQSLTAAPPTASQAGQEGSTSGQG